MQQMAMLTTNAPGHATIRMWPCLPKSMPHPHYMGSSSNPTTLLAALVVAEDAVAVDVHTAHTMGEVVEPQCLPPFHTLVTTASSRTSPREPIHLPGNVTQISPSSSNCLQIRMYVTRAVLMWKIGTQVPRATAKSRAIRMVSLGPISWNTSAQIIPSAGRPCTRQCTPAASDGVGR
jgi:hypothetical protein